MFRLSTASITVLTASLFASAAMAQDNQGADDKAGLYGNIGVTLLSTELDLTQTEVSGQVFDLGTPSPDITMLTGRLGYRLNKYFALEGEAGFGLGGDDFAESLPIDVLGNIVNVDADIGLDVQNYYIGFARGILPISDQFEVFIRGGYGTASADADVTASVSGLTASGSASESVNGFAYGLGGQFNFTKKDGIRLDYSQFDETNIVSLTYARQF